MLGVPKFTLKLANLAKWYSTISKNKKDLNKKSNLKDHLKQKIFVKLIQKFLIEL